jgi:hypothetical protein
MRIAHALATLDEIEHERLAARGSSTAGRTVPRIAGVVAWLVVGCRPAASTQPEPPAMSTAPAADTPTVAPPAERTVPPVTSNDRRHTCEIELAISSRMTHRTRTKVSPQHARDVAWKGACAELQRRDVDCRDPDRVTVVSDAPRSPSYVSDEGVQYYDHELVLAVRQLATGVGEAPGERSEACRRAKAHACEKLVGGPCPDKGVRVIAVDGKPPSAAAVEPAPTASEPSPTI